MERFLEHRHVFRLDPFYDELAALIRDKREFLDNAKGNFLRFKTVMTSIPDFSPSASELTTRAVSVGRSSDISAADRQILREKLMQLRPWRKGPFRLFGVDVDAEWRSDMKWARLAPHLPELRGRRILDIGSSNGYYMFRMAARDPLFVLGVEPQSSFYFQYLTVQKFLDQKNVFCLPVPYGQMPRTGRYFDLVFCMGILYHRKSPVEMLKDIFDSLRPKGHIILENLVLEGRQHLCLFPRDRYAKMRNVYFIPDLATMESWLHRAGFMDIRCVDVSRTTPDEQRKTDWIQTESLPDFLNPDDPEQTVEGYPGPVRAVFIARVS